MASTYTTGFGIEKIGDGEQAGAWGTTTNHNLDILDRIASYTAVALSGTTHTLTIREASPESGTENLQDGMYRVIKFTGALGANNTVTIAPNTSPAWFIVENATTDSGSSGPYSVILTQGSGANVTVLNGKNAAIFCDGAGSGAVIYNALADLQITTLDASGDITGSTLNADGDTAAGDAAAIGYTSAEGLILTGQGSTNDVTIKNDADADVITIATGATNVDIVGDLTAGTLNADGDTSAGDNATIGYTSAEGLILTGQGSTNDVTIKNDADADVVTIATGTTTAAFAGVASLADGSVSAPSLANTGDVNTGVYFPAADTVGVVTGGTEQFRFGSNPIPGGSSKNFVYNGNANVAQRGTVTGLGGVNYVYGLDGWASYGTTSGARYTMSQDTGPGAAYDAVSNNSVKIDITTADTASTSVLVSAVIQKMEGQNCQQLRWGNAGALDLTLSFWVKSSKTGTHTVALWVNDGNRGCPNNYTVDSADTWQKISVTFPGDTSGTFPPDDNTQYLFVVFPIHTGATYEGTNATWASGEIYATSSTVNLADSTSNNFWFTDVQLEVGSVATSFAYEDYGTTLARCQRYYTIWTGASTLGMSGVCRSASTGALSGLNFPVEMRAAPTMAYTTVNCVDGSAGGVDGTLSTSAAGTKSVTCSLGSASGFTDGNGLFVEIKAGDGITASAEL